jgi:hypothetical protein
MRWREWWRAKRVERKRPIDTRLPLPEQRLWLDCRTGKKWEITERRWHFHMPDFCYLKDENGYRIKMDWSEFQLNFAVTGPSARLESR